MTGFLIILAGGSSPLAMVAGVGANNIINIREKMNTPTPFSKFADNYH